MQQALDKQHIQVSELGVRVIVILYLILGALYATATPPWQAPDEPAHYNYVKYIAEQGQLPELQPGDYPHEYLEEIKAARFAPHLSVDPIRYEFHQPPLYYLVSSIVYRLNLGLFDLPMLLVLRGFGLVLGAAALLAGYNVVRAIYPQEPLLALGAAAFGATLPMHLTMTATVNNDVLTSLLLAYIAWKVFAMQPDDWTPRRSLGLGALLPWLVLKSDRARSATATYVALRVIDSLKVLFAPFLPFSSQMLHEALGYETDLFGEQEILQLGQDADAHQALSYRQPWEGDIWQPSQLQAGQPIHRPQPLFRKLEPEIVEQELARLG